MVATPYPLKLWRAWFATATLFAVLLAGANQATAGSHSFKLSAGDPKTAPGPVATRRFAELVDQKSGGKIKIKTYDSAVLGSDVQMQGALRGGIVDFALVGAPTLVGIVKEFGVLDFPFQYRESREVDAMLDGAMGRKLLDKLSDKELVGLAFWEIGFRQVTNSKRPIARWEDMSGLKIRTVQSPVFREFFNSLGANAVPMPISEVFSALETKAIDAQENPVSIIAAQRFDEVQKYLSLTGHIYTAYVLIASQKSWNQLDAADQRLIRDAAAEATAFQRKLAREENAASVEQLKKRGMQVNPLTPEERARFAEKATPVVTKFTGEIGEAFVGEWMTELGKVRQPK